MDILQIRLRQADRDDWRVLVPGEPEAAYPNRSLAMQAAHARCRVEARSGRFVTVLRETPGRLTRTRAEPAGV